MDFRQATGGRIKKRKAESQDGNDRLSKRLSLLNLERNGQKLYVPVQAPSTPERPNPASERTPDSDIMQLDNTKHKVYIYNIDDELSDSDTSGDEGKLIFLPNIKKHLLETRIPPSIRANADGELAGSNLNNELVLYNVPSSLSLPEEKDSVRKAIIESRARTREKQRHDTEIARTADPNSTHIMTERVPHLADSKPLPTHNAVVNGRAAAEVMEDDDADAMEIDG
ncbi:MAG: hypothetical protein M1818_002087 [Claussenomyces sp. TS43310]|nr:MAG: hypothetical protein M1818_002087 [Claussenomyces sp. TS43310]